MRHLEGLVELEGLVLEHTAISDACLGSLCKLKRLSFILLTGTRVTEAGARNSRRSCRPSTGVPPKAGPRRCEKNVSVDGLAGTLLGTAPGVAPGLATEGISARAIARRFGSVDRFRLLGRTGFVSNDTEQTPTDTPHPVSPTTRRPEPDRMSSPGTDGVHLPHLEVGRGHEDHPRRAGEPSPLQDEGFLKLAGQQGKPPTTRHCSPQTDTMCVVRRPTGSWQSTPKARWRGAFPDRRYPSGRTADRPGCDPRR